MEKTIRQVIAERELILDGAALALLRIGQPEQDPSGEPHWQCEFEVVGLTGIEVRTAYGIDGVQALQLCLQLIEVSLTEQAGRRPMEWIGGSGHGVYPTLNEAP